MSIPQNPYELYQDKPNLVGGINYTIWQSCSKAWGKYILEHKTWYLRGADMECAFNEADFNALKKLAEEKDNG
jgi:hypothetical protein